MNMCSKCEIRWRKRPPFCMGSELPESGKLRQFLLSDGTQIDGNEYLESLEYVCYRINFLHRGTWKNCRSILA